MSAPPNSGDNDDDDVADLGVGRTMNVALNLAEAASNGADEERELMLIEAAEHVKMARAQRALYKAKVADAVADATEGKDMPREDILSSSITARTWSCQSTTKSSPASRIVIAP